MKFVVFGLTISSSWGNGHATLWRGLCRTLGKRGHRIVFFEKDAPYYSSHRDLTELPGVDLEIYSDWSECRKTAKRHLSDADVGFVTSYCPDARDAADLLLSSRAKLRVFYDLDAPVTLSRIDQGQDVEYIPARGLRDFDFALSYTGGRTLKRMQEVLGAKDAIPLYGSVDPSAHHRVHPDSKYRSDLSYLGTYAPDRQDALNELFLKPAGALPDRRFLIGGSLYPKDFPWRENLYFVQHVPPPDHPSFFSSSRLTLNVTRSAMADMGYCPSGRLFEAAACGTPVLSDVWEGLEAFLEPGREIITATHFDEAIQAIELTDAELSRIANAARDRVLENHTAQIRALELEAILDSRMPGKAAFRSPARIWGVIPAAGMGSRIQPLAFSKELLPVGSRFDGDVERPRAVSEFLLERMIDAGASRLCFVIAPGKSDILQYYGSHYQGAQICYAVQPRAAGLCDSLFRALPFVHPEDHLLVGLPDTIWFPKSGFQKLGDQGLSFLLFPVRAPQFFDAVLQGEDGRVLEIQVKRERPESSWIWGGFKVTGRVFQELYDVWLSRSCQDEYFGTLVNAYLAQGGTAYAVRAGESYVDVGTLGGYREATQILSAA